MVLREQTNKIVQKKKGKKEKRKLHEQNSLGYK